MSRLNYFINESIIDINITKSKAELEKASKAAANYALQIGYSDFCKYVKKSGNEKNIVDFINRVFGAGITKLEDFDFGDTKIGESMELSIPSIDFNIIRKLTGIIGVSPEKVKASVAFFILLVKKYGLR